MIQVYAKADAAERVEELGSSAFLTDLTGWVQIDEGEGDRYAHAQGNYLEKPLMDADGTHNYMLGGSTIREATAAEKEAENRRRRFRQCSRHGTRQVPTKQETGCSTRMFCINA